MRPIWIRFGRGLLLQGIHFDTDRCIGGSRLNENDFVLSVIHHNSIQRITTISLANRCLSSELCSRKKFGNSNVGGARAQNGGFPVSCAQPSGKETQLSLTNRATRLEVSHRHKHGRPTIPYVRYRFLLVCYSYFVPKKRRFSDIRLQKMSWPRNPGQSSLTLKVIENVTIW